MNLNEAAAALTRPADDVQSDLSRIWSEVLEIPEESIGPDDNFFSLGGDSVLIASLVERVASQFYADRPDDAPGMAEFFSHGTIRSLAARLRPVVVTAEPAPVGLPSTQESSVAIIGMACRFPDAPDVDTFWRNLRDGVESIRSFPEGELLAAGVSAADLGRADYVKAGVLLDGVRLFDAEYFGLTPREVVITSPEQRLLIECAEEAMQDGGYGARGPTTRVGVFIGTGLSTYLLELLAAEGANLESAEGMALFASNTSAATRISYLLDLAGPSLTIDTACSSSLVAVHEACQALLRGGCTMALAGGATVRRFAALGYLAEPGGIFSQDGHCRPFDREARGTVSSSGAGIVLLKRLSDALSDGDTIRAVVRGSAINNDGGAKAGYMAPSATGQEDVVRAALAAARVDAATIQYVETHGTATPLGDVIELNALRSVFASPSSRTSPLALGALKANVGHMEAAAGIGGLIKTVLALENRQIPPAIHFRDWAPSLGRPPFELSQRVKDWRAANTPRRAGVSSFGVGGTNAHAVLEEAPAVPAVPHDDESREHLLVISARSAGALRESCRRLASVLRAESPPPLADIACTLQVGRKHFSHRAYVVSRSHADAARALESAAEAGQHEVRDEDECVGLRALGDVWQRGGAVDWRELNASGSGRRVPLPTYPFERREHWVRPRSNHGRLDFEEWFNVPLWVQRPALHPSARPEGCVVVFGGWKELESALEQRLSSGATRVVGVPIADHGPAEWLRLFETLERDGTPVAAFIHCAEATGSEDVDERPDDRNLESGLYSLFDLCGALTAVARRPAQLIVVTRGGHAITEGAQASPRRAMLTAATGVVAREFPDISCRLIDIAPAERALDGLVTEILGASTDSFIALRGARRWSRSIQKAVLPSAHADRSLLRPGGTYLVTGGLGGIGWEIARCLAHQMKAKLVLTGRSAFPDRSEWRGLLDSRPDAPVCARIREIQSLEQAGARVLVLSANAASLDEMQQVVATAVHEFGALNGVIHAAGVAGAGALHRRSRDLIAEVLAPKVMGTWAVHEACRPLDLDFFACCSSIAAVLSPAGLYEYSAANAFQDAFCEAHEGRCRTRFLSIDWDSWRDVGMGVSAQSSALATERARNLANAISPDEGVDAFRRLLSSPGARWVVSTCRLDEQPARQQSRPVTVPRSSGSRSLDAIQTDLVLIWKELLGVDAIQVEDDFFACGGDSLMVVQLRTRVETRFGKPLSLRQLLDSSTLGAMAQLLRETA